MTRRALLAAVAAPIAFLLLLTAGIAMLISGSSAACTTPATSPAPAGPAATGSSPSAAEVDGFDQEQTGNATIIITTGAQLGVPVRGWIIAVATAIQESGLRNVSHGDTAGPDSLGLFQQRDTWGSSSARLDPSKATQMFFLGGPAGQPGLLDIPAWHNLPLTGAAQAVQHSAHPGAYAGHETDAIRLVAAITGNFTSAGGTATTMCAQPPGPAAAQAVAFARQQIGVPYRWGGNGPAEGGFDCSGLTTAAYASAGIALPRTAQAQYMFGSQLPADAPLLPGDLVFFGTSPAHVTHVGIYIGNDNMIDAPHTGAAVRIESYRWTSYLGGTRPTSR